MCLLDCCTVDHLSDIEWLPSDDTDNDDDDDDDDDGDDDPVADDARPAADGDSVPSIDVLASPVVSAGIAQLTKTCTPACISQVCHSVHCFSCT